MFTTYAHRHSVQAVRVAAENIRDVADDLDYAEIVNSGRRLLFVPPGHTSSIEADVGEWIVVHHDGQITVHRDSHFREDYESAKPSE